MSAITMTSDSILKMQNRKMPKMATRRVMKGMDPNEFPSMRKMNAVDEWVFYASYKNPGEIAMSVYYHSRIIKSPHKVGKPMRIKEELVRREFETPVAYYAADVTPIWIMRGTDFKFGTYADWEWPHATLRAMLCPTWASRYNPIVTACYPQRLHEMTETDAQKEGCTTVTEYIQVWDEINGKKFPWAANWWVWVTEFVPVVECEL
jgi:hypothetical protein